MTGAKGRMAGLLYRWIRWFKMLTDLTRQSKSATFKPCSTRPIPIRPRWMIPQSMKPWWLQTKWHRTQSQRARPSTLRTRTRRSRTCLSKVTPIHKLTSIIHFRTLAARLQCIMLVRRRSITANKWASWKCSKHCANRMSWMPVPRIRCLKIWCSRRISRWNE